MHKKSRSIRRPSVHRHSIRRGSIRRSHLRSTRRSRSILSRHLSKRRSLRRPRSPSQNQLRIHRVSNLESIPIEITHVESLNPRILPTYSNVRNQVRRNRKILTVPYTSSIRQVNY